MKLKHPLAALRIAILFIALSLIFISAKAQFSLLPGTGKASTSVHTEQVRAELLAWAPEGVSAGKSVWLGLQLAHQPGWHTYWLNPGDSGLPTQLNWQLPAGVTAGAIAWPKPHKIPIGNLANYGYEGTVLLPVPLTVSPNFTAPELQVSLHATWLVCRTECIPQEGQFTLTLPSQGSTARDGALFQATLDATPRAQVAGDSQVAIEPAAIALKLTGLPAAWQGQALQFYPETGGVIETAAPWQQAWQGAVWTALIPLAAQRSASPATLPLVVALDSGPGLRLEVPVKGVWPALENTPTALPPALESALRANAAAAPVQTATGALPTGLWAACLGALLGGLMLNLMPCVFPVLAIKVVGFVQVKDRAARWRHGLAYSLGVVLSFLALGGLLLMLRALGEQLGWGFQLQSPTVVAALAVLFTLLGLNLAGLFEFGSFLPPRLAAWQAKNPSVDAFLSGVLATAVASPCTAPFMGASLGYAIGLPALHALAVFGAIGVGMALPYLILSTAPALARALPQPGPWMLRFKQLMAFPMFATVVWLVWVLGQQSGIDGAGALLLVLVLLAWALWSLTLRGTARGVIGTLALAALLWAVVSLGPTMTATTSSTSTASTGSGPWQTWGPGRVEQLTAQGQTVFVDFTAAWCVTCQYNKKTTLSEPVVMAEMAAQNIALLRADWTRRDPAVTAALTQLGRSGVPVYVFYAPGQAPVLLPEILSVQEVRAALARLKTARPG